jgi:hypothetical protein
MPELLSTQGRFFPLRGFLPSLAQRAIESFGTGIPSALLLQRLMELALPPTHRLGIPVPAQLRVWDVIGIAESFVRREPSRLVVEGTLTLIPGFEPQLPLPSFEMLSLVLKSLGEFQLELSAHHVRLVLSGASAALRFDRRLFRPESEPAGHAEIQIEDLGFIVLDSRGAVSFLPGLQGQLRFLTLNDPWVVGDTDITLETDALEVDLGLQGTPPSVTLIGGQLWLPGIGATLGIKQAKIDRTGAFELTAFGSLALPVGTAAIPEHQPLQLRFTPPGQLRLSSGAQLTLTNGVRLEAALALEDPRYAFSLALSGLRSEMVQQARDVLATLPSPLELTRERLEALAAFVTSTNTSLQAFSLQAPHEGGRPSEAAPASAPFHALEAWASGVLAAVRLGTPPPPDSSREVARELVRALAAEALQEAQGRLDVERVALRVRALRRFSLASDALGQPAGSSAEFQAAQESARALVQALLQDPRSVENLPVARRALEAALTLASLDPAQAVPLSGFFGLLRTARLPSWGLAPSTGAVADPAALEGLSLEALREAVSGLLALWRGARQSGSWDSVLATALQVLALRWRERILAALETTPAADYGERFRLLDMLREVVSAAQEGAYPYPVGSTHEADITGILLPRFEAATLAAGEALSPVGLFDRAFWPWLATRSTQLGTEATWAWNAAFRSYFQALEEQVAQEAPWARLEDAAEVLAETIALSVWIEAWRVSEEALAASLEHSLKALILPALTQAYIALAEAQRAWWALGRYADMAMLAAAQRASSETSPLAVAFLSAAARAVQSAQSVATAMGQQLPSLPPMDLRLPAGLHLKRVFGGVVYDRQTNVLSGSFGGLLEFQGPEQFLSVSGAFDGSGVSLRTTASLHLGNGVWLHPIDAATPVLELDARQEQQTVAVNALFKLPHEQGGVQSITVTGSLGVTVSQEGRIQVESFSASGRVEGSWTLPGNVRIDDPSVALSYGGGSFSAKLSGGLELGGGPGGVSGRVACEAQLLLDPADPSNIQIDTRLTPSSVSLFEQVHLFEAELRLQVRTRSRPDGTPGPWGRLDVSGKAGLFPRGALPVSGLTVDHFELALIDLQSHFEFTPAGFTLEASSGALLLPPGFLSLSDPSAPRPSVSVAPAHPVTLSYGAAGLALTGSLTVTQLRMAFPGGGAEGPQAELETATLVFDGDDLPRLEQVAGQLRLPVPGNEPLVIGFRDFAWRLRSFPTGTLALVEDYSIALGSTGFALVVRGTQPGGEPGTGLTIREEQGRPVFEIRGGLDVIVPVSMVVQDGTGESQVTLGASGTIILSPGQDPILQPGPLRIAGTFRLGGAGGVLIKDAELEAKGLDALFDPQRGKFQLTLTGRMILSDQGPGFGLTGACFTVGRSGEPTFDIEGLSCSAEHVEFIQGLPISVSAAAIRFLEPRPLPQKLALDNLSFTLSAGVRIPISSSASFIGQLEEVTVRLVNGLPHLQLDGFAVGLDNVTIVPGTLTLTGLVYAGGLTQLPEGLFLAGKVGGKVNGMGVSALVAFGLSRPPGVCLELNAGPAGIPIGQTGILITGASGGVSFVNSNGSPCDFKTYVKLDDPKHPEELPEPPPTDPPPPSGGTVPARRPVKAEDTDPTIPCPCGDCPPPSMNILCQPHPDAVAYPERAILKFTSLDRAFLDLVGLTRQFVVGECQRLGISGSQTPTQLLNAVGQLAQSVSDKLRTELKTRLWPEAPADLAAEVDRQLDMARDHLRAAVVKAFQRAMGRYAGQPLPDVVYGVLCDVAYAGVPCPDVTLELTGTMSYAGVSSFLSVTGGFSVSTAGSVGVMGSVNLVGLPVGKLRGFLTFTDETGNPIAPSICGDIVVSVGPLDLGQLCFTYRCDDLVEGTAAALVAAGSALVDPVSGAGRDFIREVLELVAEDVLENPQYDPDEPESALALLTPQQATGFVGRLIIAMQEALTPDRLQRIRDCLLTLVRAVWNSYNPELLMCGSVSPRLFGLPLGNELVAVRAMAALLHGPEGSTLRYAGSFKWSPTYLLGCIFGGGVLAAVDTAELGFRTDLPRPEDLLLDGLTGYFKRPEDLAQYLEAGFTRFLTNAVLTLQYELAPLGFKLGNVEARAIMPLLTEHPARPGSTWQPPEQRGPAYASRRELVNATLGHLGNPLWQGSAADLAALSYPEGKGSQGLSLGKDYFPHGGILGAGKLRLPPALLEKPRTEVLARIMNPQESMLTRLQSAISYLDQSVLTTEEVGSLAFYMPAPNPPITAFDGPTTPRKLMEAILAGGIDGSMLRTDGRFPAELVFLSGYVRARLLGIPIGESTVEVTPPSAGADRGGSFLVKASVPQGSWLSEFIGAASLTFTLREAPPSVVEVHFRQLRNALQAALGQLSSGSAPAAAALEEFARSLTGALPKGSLEVSLDRLTLPAAAFKLMEAPPGTTSAGSVKLYAYSVRYEPGFTGSAQIPADSLVAQARREGGIALRGKAQLRVPGILNLGGDAELAFTPAATGLPAVFARFSVTSSTSLVTGLPGLSQASGSYSAQPQLGEETLAGSGSFADVLRVGTLLSIGPRPPSATLGMSFEARRTAGIFSTALSIQPARIHFTAFGAGTRVNLHGPSVDAPFTFSTSGPWSAGVTVEQPGFSIFLGSVEALRFGSTLAGSGPASFSAQLSGQGLSSVTLQLTLPAGLPLIAFPANPLPLVTSTSSQLISLQVTVASSGTFQANASLPPLQYGVFRIHGPAGTAAPISVQLSPQGFLVKDARLSVQLPGVVCNVLTLSDFLIQSNGDFEATVTTGTLTVGTAFQFTSAGLKLRRVSGAVELTLKVPSLRLFPGNASMQRDVVLGTVDRAIGSSGQFQFTSGAQTLTVPSLFSAQGQYTIGYAPSAAYVRFACDSLSVPQPVGMTLSGGLELSTQGITGQLQTGTFRIPNTLEVAASTWSLKALVNQPLQLGAQTPSLKIFNRASVANSQISLSLSTGGVVSASFKVGDTLVLPGLFELGAGSLSLSRSTTSTQLTVSAQARVLKNPNGTWVAAPQVSFTVGEGAFEIPLTVAATTLVDLPVVRIGTSGSGVSFGRDGSGGFYLELEGLQVTLLGKALSGLGGRVGTSGALQLSCASGTSFPFGPFTLVTSAASTLQLELLTRKVNVSLSGGTLRFPTGWPGPGVTLPAIQTTGAAVSRSGTWFGGETGWKGVPGLPAEYRVTGPSVRLELNGQQVSAHFQAGKVQTRSTAVRPDGVPWAQAEFSGPSPMPISQSGQLTLPLPQLPKPPDIFASSRAACESFARSTTPIPDWPQWAHDAAVADLNAKLAACSVANPPPPPIPDLPFSLSVSLGSVVS